MHNNVMKHKNDNCALKNFCKHKIRRRAYWSKWSSLKTQFLKPEHKLFRYQSVPFPPLKACLQLPQMLVFAMFSAVPWFNFVIVMSSDIHAVNYKNKYHCHCLRDGISTCGNDAECGASEASVKHNAFSNATWNKPVIHRQLQGMQLDCIEAIA